MNTNVSIDVDYLESLPLKSLQKLTEGNQRAKQFGERFYRTLSTRPSLFRKFEELDLDVNFSLSDGDINLSFTGDAERLGAVWGELRRAGYERPHNRPEKGATSFYGRFKAPEDRFADVWLSFSSSMCKRVQIGTEMREVPIYETRCEPMNFDALEPPESAVAVVEDASDIPF